MLKKLMWKKCGKNVNKKEKFEKMKNVKECEQKEKCEKEF